MKRVFPLTIVAAALAIFLARGLIFAPFVPKGDARESAVVSEPLPETTVDSPSEIAPATPTEELTGSPGIHEGRIAKGTSFFVAMRQAGVSPVDIHNVVQASKGTFDFKRVKPGQKFAVYQGPAGQLDSLHFAIDSESTLKVRKTGDAFATRQDTVAYRTEHYLTNGTIQTSIYNALVEQDANPELSSYLAVIFQWDIDFFKDIRKGDSFTILYENRIYDNGKTVLGKVLAAKVYTRGEDHFAFGYVKADGTRSYYDEKGKSLQKSLLRAPLRYARISSNFTHRRLHPVTHTYKPHLGVDYVAPRGTPVRSTGDGTVVTATRNRSNGKYVKIRHNSRYTTYYLHLQGFAKGVRQGRRVRQGQVIGYLGSTGLVTAAHLDYRIAVNGRFVNPRTIKLPSKEPVPTDERALFEITKDACLLRFLEADMDGKTIFVERPRPPIQTRMEMLF